MFEDLKLHADYDGFFFLAESARCPPILHPHHHVELELNLVVQGTITYVLNERRVSLVCGTQLWIFPGQEHQLVDRSDDARYYVLVFKPALVERSCRGATYENLLQDHRETGGMAYSLLQPAAYDLIQRTLNDLLAGSLDSDLLNREAGFGWGSDFRFKHGDPDGLNAGLHHLLLLCWRCHLAGTAQANTVALHPAVSKALAILSMEEGAEGAAVPLSRRCGVSGAYLSRVFKSQVGVPISRYRNTLRLARFWELYRLPPQKKLTEAMYAAGFGSYAQFYKVFSEAYGQGPRNYLTAR